MNATGLENGGHLFDLGSSSTGAPYKTSDNLEWDPLADRTVTLGLMYFVEQFSIAGNLATNLYSMGIDSNHNPTGLTKVCPGSDPNCATDGNSSSGNFSFANAQIGPLPGIDTASVPTTPSASKAYWLGADPDMVSGACPASPPNTSLNSATPNGDMDTWANGDTILEWAFNGKYGGSPNGSGDGGAYIALFTYDITSPVWLFQYNYTGDTSGAYEQTYPSVAHQLISGHDYQVLATSYMGTYGGSTQDSTLVKVFKDSSSTPLASNQYSFGIGTNVQCGRWGDYSTVAPDVCGSSTCVNSINNLEFFANGTKTDGSHPTVMYGNVSLP